MMKQKNPLCPNVQAFRKIVFAIAFALLTFALPAGLRAQTAAIYGSVSNFDVVNHTEHEAHGFEIEFEGLQIEDVYYTFNGQRYGSPKITATATGILVRWESPYVAGAFTKTTIARNSSANFAGSCYQWGANYNASGCEHFGASLTKNPLKTTYRWLIEDANAPGNLVGFNPPVAIPNPVYIIVPPAQQGEAPELAAEIEAPEAAEAPELYGNAQWVKVFKTELQREVGLDELVSDNAIVPQNQAQVEVAWEIIQAEPASNSNSNGNRRQRRNQGSLSPNTRSVVRRYEIYQFTGAYDPVTHEALCGDAVCAAPANGELGEYIGAQMSAANVAVPSISVSKNGNGTVTATGADIRCGATCTAFVNGGSVVTLTATPDRDNVFTGWSGACAGNQTSCTITVNDSQNVTANFAPTFAVSVKTAGGKGTVTAAEFGINCGKTCSARVTQGKSVTFTVKPDAGFRFVNWTGGCTGTALTCTIAVTKEIQVQANFTK